MSSSLFISPLVVEINEDCPFLLALLDMRGCSSFHWELEILLD